MELSGEVSHVREWIVFRLDGKAEVMVVSARALQAIGFLDHVKCRCQQVGSLANAQALHLLEGFLCILEFPVERYWNLDCTEGTMFLCSDRWCALLDCPGVTIVPGERLWGTHGGGRWYLLQDIVDITDGKGPVVHVEGGGVYQLLPANVNRERLAHLMVSPIL